MTYCLAMRLDEGLLFLSDTRTNAGIDNVSTYRKLHVRQPGEDRLFVLQSAGSLASTQEVLDRIALDLEQGAPESLATVSHLFEAALYVGRLSTEVAARHRATLGDGGACTFIVGGQVAGAAPDVLLVYPEGNYIRASEDRPFLQIGEFKYGKVMLDLTVVPELPMASAARVALSSMISTARANLSVGPPYDLGVYRPGSFSLTTTRIDAESRVLSEVQELWSRLLLEGIGQLPHIDDLF